MILFLTSSPTGPLDNSYPVDGLDSSNGFPEQLARFWPEKARVLMISAFPDDIPANEEMGAFFERTLRESGLSMSAFTLLDRRQMPMSFGQIRSHSVLLLGGGHVPTQNAFFRELRLRECLESYDGLILGISAGSMNAADVVYAQPEEPGEATDPDYVRFLPGLGLTRTQILPHYQMVRDRTLDGLSLYQDITRRDSFGRRFLILPDGSYLLSQDGQERVYGEAYQMADGVLTQICTQGGNCSWSA